MAQHVAEYDERDSHISTRAIVVIKDQQRGSPVDLCYRF